MKKNIVIIIIIGVLLTLVIITGIFILMNYSNDSKDEQSASFIGIGNTNGNLNNYGFVVEEGNWIYYLVYEENAPNGICRIEKNGIKSEKITADCGWYLNTDEAYLYYLDFDDNIKRMNIANKKSQTLVENAWAGFSTIKLIDGWIYYTKDDNFYRIRTDGTKEEKLLNTDIDWYQITNDYIYYLYQVSNPTSIETTYELYRVGLDGKNNKKLNEFNTSSIDIEFYVKDNIIYYIFEDSITEEYGLYKISADGGKSQKIKGFNGGIASANMTDNGIYHALCDYSENIVIYYMDYDGKNQKKITTLERNSTPINVIDDWIFYLNEDKSGETRVFRVKIDGSSKQAI